MACVLNNQSIFRCRLYSANILAEQWMYYSEGTGVTQESLSNTSKRHLSQLLHFDNYQPEIACFQEVETKFLDKLINNYDSTYTCSELVPNLVSSAKLPTGVVIVINNNWKHQMEQNGCQFHLHKIWLDYGQPTNQNQKEGSSALLLVITQNNQQLLNLVNCHLDFGGQTEQLQNLVTYLQSHQIDMTKLVLVGDLNETWSKLKPMLPLAFNLDNLLINEHNISTYFNGNDPTKNRQIDHILVSTGLLIGSHIKVPEIDNIQECVDIYGSDHVPIRITLSN